MGVWVGMGVSTGMGVWAGVASAAVSGEDQDPSGSRCGEGTLLIRHILVAGAGLSPGTAVIGLTAVLARAGLAGGIAGGAGAVAGGMVLTAGAA
jgi:hypothetical protein